MKLLNQLADAALRRVLPTPRVEAASAICDWGVTCRFSTTQGTHRRIVWTCDSLGCSWRENGCCFRL
ncbi:hypothetical protein [Streptomyces carpaticus]|uniref:Transposase n=1 Tax=Streptomyces carpaticus TaxID=285558 RepID=A0ABV4ZNX5_9ACTN